VDKVRLTWRLGSTLMTLVPQVLVQITTPESLMIIELDTDEVVKEDAVDAVEESVTEDTMDVAEEIVDAMSTVTTVVIEDILLAAAGDKAVAPRDKTVTMTKNFQGWIIKLYADHPARTTQ